MSLTLGDIMGNVIAARTFPDRPDGAELILTELLVDTRFRYVREATARFGFAMLVLLCAAGPTAAANHYVRPNGGPYGVQNGTDWSNAFNGFSGIAWASVAPGDTIWIAGGTYTDDLTPAKSGTATSRIYIRRARADAPECTQATGWGTAFDATVHQVRRRITFNSFNYITVSGRTSATGGTYGWWIDYRGATAGPGVHWPNGSTGSHIVIEYLRVQGPGKITYSADGRGIDDTPFSTATNHTFSHLAIHEWESGVYVAGMSNPTFEYIDMYDIHAVNWSTFHPNGIYTSKAPNGIVRYSAFHRGPSGGGVGEGIFFEQVGGSTGWQIYGNLFYDLNSTGLKSIQITSNVGNIKIFNNTFDDTGVAGVYVNGGSCGSGAEVRNNLAYRSSFNTCGTNSNNLVVTSTSIWADRPNRDYHIVATIGAGFPRDVGIALSSNGFYDRDPDGTTRGTDGAWDVGAFEFGTCASCPTAPRAPSNLRIIR